MLCLQKSYLIFRNHSSIYESMQLQERILRQVQMSRARRALLLTGPSPTLYLSEALVSSDGTIEVPASSPIVATAVHTSASNTRSIGGASLLVRAVRVDGFTKSDVDPSCSRVQWSTERQTGAVDRLTLGARPFRDRVLPSGLCRPPHYHHVPGLERPLLRLGRRLFAFDGSGTHEKVARRSERQRGDRRIRSQELYR